MSYCKYYQARIARARAWFFVAILRSYEYMCFDRTLDATESIFEFFVPTSQEDDFLHTMQYFEKEGIISEITKLPNRLESQDTQISVWD